MLQHNAAYSRERPERYLWIGGNIPGRFGNKLTKPSVCFAEYSFGRHTCGEFYRQDIYEIPPDAIRELIINAAVHRS